MTCAFKLITHPTGLFFVAVATARIRQFNQLALLASERCPLNIFETLLQQLRELRGRGLLVSDRDHDRCRTTFRKIVPYKFKTSKQNAPRQERFSVCAAATMQLHCTNTSCKMQAQGDGTFKSCLLGKLQPGIPECTLHHTDTAPASMAKKTSNSELKPVPYYHHPHESKLAQSSIPLNILPCGYRSNSHY